MSYTDQDRVLALAGIYQAARLARDIARTGKADQAAMGANLHALFAFDPDSVAAVYGGEQAIALGLDTLLTQLQQPQQRDMEIARYVIAMIHLADKLRKTGQLDAIGEQLSALHHRIVDFDLPRANRIAQVERIYQSEVSTIQPQIMVRGEPLYLQNSEMAGQIRCMLLTGIRSAVLWRQCGGKKLQLLFGRRQIANTVQQILHELNH